MAGSGAGAINEPDPDDFVFHSAGCSPLSSDHTGTEQIFGFFGKLIELDDGTSKVECTTCWPKTSTA
jgi:hypothetical protein